MGTQLASIVSLPFAEGHCQRGDALAGQGRLDEAVACLQAALLLRADYAKSQHNLAVAFARLSRPEDAACCLRQALALNPHYAEAHYNLGNVLLSQKRVAAADCYRQALALRPGAQNVSLISFHLMSFTAPDSFHRGVWGE